MKRQLKNFFFLILLATLLVPSFSPYPTQAADVKNNATEGTPVSFQILSTNDEGIDLTISAPSYQVSQTKQAGQTFDAVSVPGAYQNTASGQPELPIASVLIGVPAEATVSLSFQDKNTQEIEGHYQIALAPFPARQAEEQTSVNQWDYELANTRELNQLQATEPFAALRIAEDAWMRDQRVIRLEYSPFEYNASTGELIWHPDLNVHLKFNYPADKATLNLSPTSSANQTYESLLRSSLLNYEQARDWRALPAAQSAQVTPPDVGNRYRIAINEDGIYQLTYEELVAVSADISGTNPQYIKMTNQGDEIAIQVVDDDGNNLFNAGDYIIFYGQRFYGDRLADLYQDENLHYRTYTAQDTDGSYMLWKPQFNEIMLEKYTHENIYWLYEDTSNGLRMETIDGDPASNSNDPVPYYRETVHAEESTIWSTLLVAGEDTWFWERILVNSNPPVAKSGTYTTSISARATTGPNAVIRAEFISTRASANTGDDHHTKVYFNNTEYADFWWSGKSRYHFEHAIPPEEVENGINALEVEALTDGQIAYASYYFDWFEIEYNRLFEAQNNAITFNNSATGLNKYQVNGFSNTNDLHILDISNPLMPKTVTNPATTSSQVTISLTHSDPLTATISAGTQNISESQLSYYVPINWANMTAGFDYIFITHSDFLTATQSLATYRETASGLSTLVLDIDTIYNEFNFGIFNPIAIKNFLAYTFDQWDTPPAYALLVGDGHWNFHEYNLPVYGETPQFIPPNLAWVDPWQYEVDSANILATVVGTDPMPDLMIARLPVNHQTEIEAYLSKLTAYEAPHTPEAWERNHLFIAEDADNAGDYPAFGDAIIDQYITPAPLADEIRIYQDDYGCSTPGSIECTEVRNAITNTLNITGSLIVNYIGHASLRNWSKESVFTPDQFPALSNNDKLPVILSMDCLDGYWSGPTASPGSSMIEMIVRQSGTGAIAAFSPTGLGVSTGHDILHKGFYDALMVAGNWEMGSATQNAKLWLFQAGVHADLLHTYTVFGDPALQIRHSYQIYLPLTVK